MELAQQAIHDLHSVCRMMWSFLPETRHNSAHRSKPLWHLDIVWILGWRGNNQPPPDGKIASIELGGSFLFKLSSDSFRNLTVWYVSCGWSWALHYSDDCGKPVRTDGPKTWSNFCGQEQTQCFQHSFGIEFMDFQISKAQRQVRRSWHNKPFTIHSLAAE